MKANLLLLKQWCERDLSPMAWQRIALQAYARLRDKGYSIKELQNPPADMNLEGEDLAAICDAIRELYKTDVPLNDLA